MEVKFLQQEKEFHRYNAQLELKTNALMKEVEKVMTIQDNFVVSPKANFEKTRYKSVYLESDGAKEECDSKYVDYSKGIGTINARSESLNSLHIFRESETTVQTPRENDDDLFEENKKSSASDKIIRILSSKVKILQNEVNSLRSDYRKKVDEWKKCQISIKLLEEEKNKAISQIGALREQNIHCHASSTDIASKLQLRDSENASLKKEVEKLKKELKSMTQVMNHNEVRMNRALEEIDKLKTSLQASNLHEKEIHTSARRNADHLTSMIRKLEKQKFEILQAFHKQVKLIENLKTQKEVQEASLMVKLAEKNFSELLDTVPTLNHSQHIPKS